MGIQNDGGREEQTDVPVETKPGRVTVTIYGVEIETSIPYADLLVFAEAADNAGLDLRDYSGRGMYGNETLAVRCESEAEVGDLMAELPKDMRRRVRTDSLGRAIVAYLNN